MISSLLPYRPLTRPVSLKPAALLVGESCYLEQAFPDDLRQEIAGRFDLSRPSQTAQSVLLGDLGDIEVIFATWDMPLLTRDFLARAPHLRAIFYAAGTVKYFATPEAYARGITICGAWRANAIPVAEYTLSVILLSLRKFWETSRRSGLTRAAVDQLGIPGTYRKKIGLVSLGAIGLRVAELLRPFGFEILAYDPYCEPLRARLNDIELVSLDRLFRECDVVSVHAPLLPETTGLISAPLVSAMKEGAALINTARGAVLDEDPVLAVLSHRQDLTAILDVAITEPPPPSSLICQLENVIYTPHIAGSRGSEIRRMGEWMVEEARRFLAAEPLLHEITVEMLGSVA